MRRWILGIVIVLGLLAPAASAQRLRRPRDIQWTTFVGGRGQLGQTVAVDDSPGRIDLGDSPWQCGYARTRQAQVARDDWSVQRVLACRRDAGTVSATATCRVRRGVLDERAVTLSLGTVGESVYRTVTLGCRRRRAAP